MEAATIFVYGTLKRGCRNHGLLKSAEFLSEAQTEPGCRMVDCGSHPGLVRAQALRTEPGRAESGRAEQAQAESQSGDPAGIVFGELYRVDAELLAALDRFEDVPNEYERAAIRLSDGQEAQAYFYRGETAHLPVCGPIWREP